MMNKYQEALDNLIRASCPRKVSCKECDFEKLCNSQAKGYIDTIQELVDRATPKKPERIHANLFLCGNKKCDAYFSKNRDLHERFIYCPFCGKAIDWSD